MAPSLALLGALISASHSAMADQNLDWAELVDTGVQVFDDPYRELEPDQLERLVAVAGLGASAEAGEAIDSKLLRRLFVQRGAGLGA